MGDKVEKPLFNFRNVSHKWGKDVRNVGAQITQTQLILRGTLIEGAGEADVWAQQKLQSDALIRFNELTDERDALICKTLVSVPRSWLVDDAPDGLNWQEAGSLDWLLEARYNDLMEAMNEAQVTAKN